MTTVTATATATDKQVGFITKLLGERELTETNRGSVDRALARGISKREASQMIDWLMTLPRKSSTGGAVEGMHKFGGVIFKVQRAVHGSGNLYAKALVEDGAGGWVFEYAPGAVRNLSEATKLSLEEAKQFGVLYGTCCVCGRTLTNEDSIADGIGPVCATKF